MGTEGQPVRFRSCTCPGTPHDGRDGADDGDIVVMRPFLDFAAGSEALRKIIESDGEVNRVAELVGPVYVREGPESWNVVDERGPVPLDTASILVNYSWSYPIAEKGDDLYSQAVLAPLLERTNGTSGSTPNGKSTSRTRRSPQARHSRPGSSSQNGMAGTPSVVAP